MNTLTQEFEEWFSASGNTKAKLQKELLRSAFALGAVNSISKIQDVANAQLLMHEAKSMAYQGAASALIELVG